MRVKITVIRDNGEELEISRKIGGLDSANILSSVEQEVLSLQREISPFLAEKTIEDHRSGFVGEKNQEEERDT